MLDRVVKDWLSEYKGLSREEVRSFASTIRQNEELVQSLYKLFESKPSVEHLDPVCHQLFEFYRSKQSDLRIFALEYVPTLIWLYLSCLSHNDKKSCGGVEAFILGVYNLEIVHSDGKAKVMTFRIPSFGQPSVYHEPSNLSTLTLTESALSRYNQSQETWKSGPYPQYESVNGQNRHGILSYIMSAYNSHMVSLATRSHQSLCKIASRLATTGFSNLLHHSEADSSPDSLCDRRNGFQSEVLPRIPVSPALLVEMLSGVYYVMFNGQANVGIQSVEDIHSRACYELYSDVQLVTSAILNSLKYNPSGQPQDGPMGISIALSSSSSTSGLAKSALTNASFRTKKLPDDISVPTTKDNVKLEPIDEDGDQGQGLTKGARSSGKKAAKKGDKIRGKDVRKDSDASAKSAIFNGDSSDSISVAVVKGQSKSVVDNLELHALPRRSGSHDDPYVAANGSDDSFQSEKSRSLPATSRSKDSKNGSINQENFSTDL
ncbi:protein FAM126B-like [Haliotis rubra]|uniref:protein FAM126B-like n=1 Tax=Haliotis rubra TaxID=36100 RepID=UPI001EE52954|nr:protein FAM126B-like [Haliotis rubra]